MTQKRPVAFDHTHEPSTPSYDGFQSKTDKVLLDELRVKKPEYDALLSGVTVEHDTTLTGDGTVATPLSVVNDGHTHDTRYYTESEVNTLLSDKQATLVSGTNIKTVNSNSLLGSGNVAVQPTLVSGTNIKTINGSTILGSGNLVASENGNTGSVFWTQFLDGTMMIYASASASLACSTAMGAGGGFRTAAQTLSLPVSFVDTNYKVVVTPDNSFFNIGGGGKSSAVDSLVWFLTSVSSDATARTRVAQIIAIGRWK